MAVQGPGGGGIELGLDYSEPKKEENYYKIRVDIEDGKNSVYLYLKSKDEVFIEKNPDVFRKIGPDFEYKVVEGLVKVGIEKITEREYKDILKSSK